MSYYVRAFCTTGVQPAMAPVLEYASALGSAVKLHPDVTSVDPADPTWEQVGLHYKDGKHPILLEVNRDGDGDQDLMREEIEEFLEFLEDVPNDGNRRRVEKHLRATTFIVAAQLATDDIDDDGYNALGNVLRYFVANNGAIIQADGEGFYDGEELIVEVE